MTMTTDPIADMLTRVRNALHAGHKRVDIPLSKQKVAIARKLTETHLIENYKVIDDGRHGLLRLYLRYTPEGESVIRSLKRVSKPGRRRYVGKSDVPRVRGGMGIAILSTSKGVMTDHEARAEGIGGEVLAVVH